MAAAYDPAAIRTQLKTLIQTSSAVAYVYDYFNPNVDGYPAVIFDISDDNSDMMDDSNDLVSLTFTIYIMVKTDATTSYSTGKTLLDNAVKSVNVILMKKSNDTLSNTVDWIMPTMGSRKELPSTEGTVIVQEMKLKCMVAATIL